jgi:hypothetical protein
MKGVKKVMCRIKHVEHWGFHFGFQAELENGPGMAPDYPRESEWELVRDHLGILDADEKMAFVQAFRRGIEAEECPSCGNGVHGHNHFMSVIYR